MIFIHFGRSMMPRKTNNYCREACIRQPKVLSGSCVGRGKYRENKESERIGNQGEQGIRENRE